MLMYDNGDYIICRSGGIWSVSKKDNGQLYLSEHGQDASKILPENSEEIIRKIVSKKDVLDIVSRIPYIRTIQAPNDRIRMELYEDAMREYDEIEWVKIVKTIYLRQQEKRIAPAEAEYADKAKGYLHGEISVILNIPMDEVNGYIASSVASDTW